MAAQELATREKEEVGLQERRKHAASKAKKLRKALQDVSHKDDVLFLKFINTSS